MNYYFVVDKDLSPINYNCYHQLDVACLVMLEHLMTKSQLLHRYGIDKLDPDVVYVEQAIRANGTNITIEKYFFSIIDGEIIRESTNSWTEDLHISPYYTRIHLLEKRLHNEI